MSNTPHTDIKLQKSLLIDLDGTVLRHFGSIDALLNTPTELLPGVKEKFQEWNLRDYKIVITTGRRESLRKFTEKQLEKCGITYDDLIMGMRRGERVVLNDHKPNSTIDTCRAINVDRNQGLEGLDI